MKRLLINEDIRVTFDLDEMIDDQHLHFLNLLNFDFSDLNQKVSLLLTGNLDIKKEALKDELMQLHPAFQDETLAGNFFYSEWIPYIRANLDDDILTILKSLKLFSFPAGTLKKMVENSDASKKAESPFSGLCAFLDDMKIRCMVLLSDDISEINVMSIDSKYFMLSKMHVDFPQVEQIFHRQYQCTNKQDTRLKSNDIIELVEHNHITKPMSSLITDAKECYQDYVTDIFSIQTFYDILSLEFAFLLNEKANIKHCHKCNKLFLSQDKDDIFCHYPSGGDSCRDWNQEQIRQNEIKNIYRRVYKTLFEQTRTGKLSKEEFTVWNEKAKKYRKDALNGTVKPEPFKKKLLTL